MTSEGTKLGSAAGCFGANRPIVKFQPISLLILSKMVLYSSMFFPGRCKNDSFSIDGWAAISKMDRLYSSYPHC